MLNLKIHSEFINIPLTLQRRRIFLPYTDLIMSKNNDNRFYKK